MNENPIIWFDDSCLLCNRSVQFIHRRDPDGHFRFGMLKDYVGDSTCPMPDSIILEMDNKRYTGSTAVLHILRHLKTPLRFAYVLIWIPRPIRDFFYRIVARNRYRWFGRTSRCMLMHSEYHNRFVCKSS
jgi:predicted DCC family thiol-disulfide oxidoreductase YuxK